MVYHLCLYPMRDLGGTITESLADAMQGLLADGAPLPQPCLVLAASLVRIQFGLKVSGSFSHVIFTAIGRSNRS